jgi:hypothetical protein
MLPRSRILAFALIPAVTLLIAAILIAGSNTARAASATYADPGGTCAGLTPCFTTIQAAVNNAGPAPATVSVFPGTYNETVDLGLMGSDLGGGVPGDLTLQAVDAAGSPANGTATINGNPGEAIWNSVSPFAGALTIDGLILNSATDSGIDTDPTGAIVFTDNQVNGSAFNNNLSSGGNVTVANSTFNTNAGSGLRVYSDGDITVTNSTANDNDGSGFDLEAGNNGQVTVTGSTANNNFDGEGFDIETDGGVSVTSSEASGNYDEGFEIDPYNEQEAATVTFSDVVANDSETDDGIDIQAGNVTITNATANGNADEGIQTVTSGTSTIDRVTAHGNLSDGIDVEGISTKGWFVDSVTIVNSDLRLNEESGIESLEDSTVVGGSLGYTSNVICGNIVGGIESFDDDPVNATGNWWGAASGPTHPSNAAGTGDDVFDAANPGGEGALGTVDFDPWISTSSGSGSAVVGVPSTISFQFTGPGGSPALQEGPGDETGASPFTVTTDNGTATVGFITAGKLEVTLTAATVGTANVTVTGPCGLATAALPVAVAAAQGTPAPTPAQLPDTGGSAESGSRLPVAGVVALAAVVLAAAGCRFAIRRAR